MLTKLEANFRQAWFTRFKEIKLKYYEELTGHLSYVFAHRVMSYNVLLEDAADRKRFVLCKVYPSDLDAFIDYFMNRTNAYFVDMEEDFMSGAWVVRLWHRTFEYVPEGKDIPYFDWSKE